MTEEPVLHPVDERLINLIAERVAAMLRAEVETLAGALSETTPPRPLSVEQVAERFGVARSTVYAHWREWGGYKLGDGEKAAIRFDPSELPTQPGRPHRRIETPATPKRAVRHRRRQELLPSEPRLPSEFEGCA